MCVCVYVCKGNADNVEENGSEAHDAVETLSASELSESTITSTAETASTTTTKTTFDELMQALSELEADDPLPPASHRAPSWRE